MSIVNRRNAMIGWVAWNVGKRVARRKGREALPDVVPEKKRSKQVALVALLAAAGGAVLFWRTRSGDDTPEPLE
jgi:hypothetical protein